MITRLIETSLHAKGLVLVAFFAVIGYGVYAYRQMPVDAFPDISPIMVPVFAEGHGMAPEEIERLITYPIESAMNGLPGVTQIKSTSAFGMAVIYVYFRDNVDIYFARQLVAERPVLPTELIGSIYERLGIDPDGPLPNERGLEVSVLPAERSDESAATAGVRLEELL